MSGYGSMNDYICMYLRNGLENYTVIQKKNKNFHNKNMEILIAVLSWHASYICYVNTKPKKFVCVAQCSNISLISTVHSR